MYQVIIVIHVMLGLGIIGLIMIQQGKGADAGATFGSGASGSVFGAQGAASFLSRTTAILASLFFLTSLGLAIINGRQESSNDLMDPSAIEQSTKAVPEVDNSKAAEIPAIPAANPASTNVAPTQQPVDPSKLQFNEEIKPITVPNAELIKPVEENKNASSKSQEEQALEINKEIEHALKAKVEESKPTETKNVNSATPKPAATKPSKEKKKKAVVKKTKETEKK